MNSAQNGALWLDQLPPPGRGVSFSQALAHRSRVPFVPNGIVSVIATLAWLAATTALRRSLIGDESLDAVSKLQVG